jgi:hypothetical protein
MQISRSKRFQTEAAKWRQAPWLTEYLSRAMKNTYRSTDEASQDKAQLGELLDALNASPSTLRRDDCGLWVLRGARGYCSTWGDDATWQIVMAPEQEMTALRWTWAKRRLSFCEVTQDGDAEGVFRLHQLPTAAEAEEIRSVLGLWKRTEWSPEALARRQQAGRLLAASGRPMSDD